MRNKIKKNKLQFISFEVIKITKISHCCNSSKIQLKNRRNTDKTDTPNTHILDSSLPWLVTNTSLNRSKLLNSSKHT